MVRWGRYEGGAVAETIGPEFEKRTAPGYQPWLHNKCRTRESENLIMVLTGHADSVETCTFSSDGQTLASASDEIRFWDAATGIKRAILEGHTDWVSSCDFSPDGKILASAGSDKTVRLWDLAMG